jgi:hypothetical protein
VVNKHAGKFVPSDHKMLMEHIPFDGLISVLGRQFRGEWVLQEPSVPIAVSPDARVLIRLPKLADDDCGGLADETLTLWLAAPLSKSSTRVTPVVAHSCNRLFPRSSTASSKILDHHDRDESPVLESIACDSPSPTDLDVAADRVVKPIPFPLTFVCEMAPGMEIISQLQGVAMVEAFKTTFPKSAYKKPTVYKHINVYNKASKLGLLPRYIDYGRVPAGRWSALVAEVSSTKGIPTW